MAIKQILTENVNRVRVIEFRNVTKEDIPQIIPMLKAFSIQCGGKHSLYPEDEEYAVKLLETLIDGHVFYCATNRSKVVGFIAGTLSNHLMNQKIRVLNEVFFYVDPSFRKSKAAKVLLDSFIDYGNKVADWLIFGLIDKATLGERTLEKRGFRMKERSFLLEV